MKDTINIVLESSSDLLKEEGYDKELEEIKDLDFSYTDEYSEYNIPVYLKCPHYATRKRIKALIERMTKLKNNKVSNTIYKKIGITKLKDDTILTAFFIIEPNVRRFNQEELREIINNDDPEYVIE